MADISSTTPAAPVIARSQTVWERDKLFRSGNGTRTHLIDAGAAEAPGPVETLLSAIATCSGVDVLAILEKRRTPVESLEIDVEGERRPEQPRRLTSIRLAFRITGAGIDVESADRAIQLSFEKYCSVAGSLGADIRAETVLTLNGTTHPAVPRTIWRPE